jgi:hypothetical protein
VSWADRAPRKKIDVEEHRFTFIFDVASVPGDTDQHVENLGANACDDAIVGVGKAGRLALAFDREGESAKAAVLSALRNVKQAIPEAVLIEATPDFVDITDVAQIVGRSRQNIRQLLLSRGTAAPAPVHEGNPSLWHLAELLVWLRDQKSYRVQSELIELARTNMQLNIAVSRREMDDALQGEIGALFA